MQSALGVARCGRSAGCVLCVLWVMSAAVLGGGVPCGGKHIIIVGGLLFFPEGKGIGWGNRRVREGGGRAPVLARRGGVR